MRRHEMRVSGPGMILAGLLMAAACGAQDDKVSSALDSVRALKQEFEAASRDWMQSYSAAGASERKKLIATRPQATAWAARFQKFVDADPKSTAAAEAAAWMILNRGATGIEQDRMIGVLLAHHVASAELATVCGALARVPSLSSGKLLRAAESQNPDVSVRAQACFALAEWLKNRASMVRTVKRGDAATVDRLVSAYGRESVDVMKNAEPDALEKEAGDFYEKVSKTPDYAGQRHYVGTLGKAADASLFEMRNLAIGKVAPEISGEDIDGNPMKLSDYRGKVVVLDFWGDW